MKNVKKINCSYHRWIWFAYSYLALTEIGLEKLKEGINNPNNIRSIKDYFAFRKKYLFIPIIYNLKHALEIILKGLNIQANNEYIQTHDAIINKKALQLIISKFSDKEKLKNLDKIVDKYYRIEFFNKNLSQKIKISDVHNDIFRFPENSARFFLDSECFGVFEKSEVNKFIDELKEDLTLLFNLLIIISDNIKNSKR